MIAFQIAVNDLYDKWNDISNDLFNPKAANQLSEVHAIISSLKAVHSWIAMRSL